MAEKAPETLSAERIELLDHRGRVRGTLGQLEHNGFGFELLDREGGRWVSISMTPGAAILSLGVRGNTALELGALDAADSENPEPGPYMHLMDGEGNSVVQMVARGWD